MIFKTSGATVALMELNQYFSIQSNFVGYYYYNKKCFRNIYASPVVHIYATFQSSLLTIYKTLMNLNCLFVVVDI